VRGRPTRKERIPISRQSDEEFVENLNELMENEQTEVPLVCPTCEVTHPAKDFTYRTDNDGAGMYDENGREYSAGGGSSDTYDIMCPDCWHCECENQQCDLCGDDAVKCENEQCDLCNSNTK
jgi:hypothetical protein